MRSLIFKSYKLNLFQNFFMIIQLTILLVLFNSAVSGLVYDGKISNYINNYDNTTVLLSGAIENNISASDSKSFKSLVNELKTLDGINDVGYSIEESTMIKNSENTIIKTLYFNPAMCEIKYPLSSGKWFEKQCSDMQIIIGGELNHKYNVGERITLSRIYYGNGMQTQEFEAVIIGKLKNPAFVMDLNYNSNRPVLQNLFESEQNIILTNDYRIVDESNLYFPLGSLLLDIDESISDETIKSIEQYGQYHSLDSVQENSIEILEQTIRKSFPPVIILFISIMFGFIGFTYLYTYKFMKNLSIFYLCGTNKTRLTGIVASQTIISCLVSIILMIIVKVVPSFSELFFKRALWGMWNYILTFGITAAVVLIALISSKILLRKNPLEVLRRYE